MKRKVRPFMTIGTIEGNPLPPKTPIDPVAYEEAVRRLVARGMRPPKPFRSRPTEPTTGEH